MRAREQRFWASLRLVASSRSSLYTENVARARDSQIVIRRELPQREVLPILVVVGGSFRIDTTMLLVEQPDVAMRTVHRTRALIGRNHVARVDNHLEGVDSQVFQVNPSASIAVVRVSVDHEHRIVGAHVEGWKVDRGSVSHLLPGEHVAGEHVISVVVEDGCAVLRLTWDGIWNQTKLCEEIQIVPAEFILALLCVTLGVYLTVNYGTRAAQGQQNGDKSERGCSKVR